MSLPIKHHPALDRIHDPDLLIQRDLKVLVEFIGIYCSHKHTDEVRDCVRLKSHDVASIAGHQVSLCEACTKLLNHALVKRSTCPLYPKPACRHCTEHCYHPAYREKIKEIMKYSGLRSVLTGRLDYLFHLLF